MDKQSLITIGLILGSMLAGLAVFIAYQAEQISRRIEQDRQTDRRRDARYHELGRKLDTQVNIGGRIYNELVEAGHRNPSGKIRVYKEETLGFSVSVGYEDKSSITFAVPGCLGYPVLEVNVNIFRDKPILLTIGTSPRPEDGIFNFGGDDQSVVKLTKDLCARVESYCPFV